MKFSRIWGLILIAAAAAAAADDDADDGDDDDDDDDVDDCMAQMLINGNICRWLMKRSIS